MKAEKTLFGFAALVFAAVLFLFAGCNDTQQIEGTVSFPKASAPSNVRAEGAMGTSHVRVSWDAASNATGYSVYMQQEGKKTIHSVTSFYSSPDSNEYDDDKWSCEVSLASYRTVKLRFGVSATSAESGVNKSDIEWSDYI
ncbi:MAG: hypothetical protein LBG87_05050 [Spirochaetaceae bacterium]|jgi:hypothetical protein|nr:hypothetical protein [Spirochaetaceae bacterium]